MKKIFTFIAAMLVAFAASAATININTGTADALRLALNSANSGDVIVMAAGTYVESNENYIAFTGKNVTVKAADGAEVIIQPKVPVRLKSGARAEFIGVKFDCGHLSDLASYSHLIVPADNTDGKKVILTDCEFYGWTQNSAIIQTPSDRKLDSIVIKDCYFHDCNKSFLHYTNANLVGLEIKNSTFAKLAAPADGYWAAPIYVQATSGSLLVDHCTFYDCQVMSLSYGVVTASTLTNSIVSNCIFALPATADMCATNLPAGGIVKNSLTHLYDNWQPCGHYTTATVIDCIAGNPLFADAANADYTLEEGSPALGTATNGGNLGDSRWWPAVPSAATTVYFAPGVWNQDGAKYAIYAYEPGNTPEFQWSDFLALAENETNIYTGTVPAGYSHLVFVRLNAACATPCWEDKWNQTRNLTIVEGGKNLYTIDAWGDTDMPSPGTWSTYVAPTVLENGYYIAGVINGASGWNVSDLSADRQLIHSNEVDEEWSKGVTLAVGDEFKVVYVENNAISAWYPDGMDNNYEVVADHAGDKTVYFRPDGQGGSGWHAGFIYVEPNPIQLNLVAGWNTVCLPYAAEIANVDAYEIQDINFGSGTISLTPSNGALTAAKSYLINAAAAGEHTATLMGGKVTTPVEVDGFLGNLSETPVVLYATDENYGYFVLSGNEFHQLTGDATATVNQYKAYIRMAKNFLAPSVLRIVNGATNIQNIEGNETAVKFIENGKLFIKKNGVVYDAVGTVVK